MIGPYAIKVNGLVMDTVPTLNKALVVITRNFHQRANVIVEKNGVTVWNSEKGAI